MVAGRPTRRGLAPLRIAPVLVIDESLPKRIAAELKARGRDSITVATIDPKRADGITPDAWRREIIHRWAHAMAAQGSGTIVRYSAGSARRWTHRRR